MKNFAEFTLLKEKIVGAYDILLKESNLIFPFHDMDANLIKERQKNIQDDKFKVAVCGQMNSGKSSLINALIFKEPVLPTFDTVMTVKNTIIKYGETPSFQVEFYDADEWKLIKDEINKDKIEWENFNNEITLSAKKYSVHVNEYILNIRKSITEKGYEKLKLYVIPVEKGGRFSPFVKQVIVFSPCEWLKNATITDTPGVNDPLKFREDITKNWIAQAGAVLYVSYAGQAMSRPDIDFLDQYLLHVSPKKRVIAINKIDTQANLSVVEDFVESLRNSEDRAIRSVFGNAGSTRYVSSLGAIISYLEMENKPLSEDLSAYRQDLEYKGCLNEKGHHVDSLRNLVESRLMEIKGDDLVEDHINFLSTLFERKLMMIDQDAVVKNNWISEISNDIEDNQIKIKNITGKQSRVNAKLELFSHEIKVLLENKKADLKEIINNTSLEISKCFKIKLDKLDRMSEIGRDAAWELKNVMYLEIPKLYRKLNDEFLKGIISDIKAKGQKLLIDLGRDTEKIEFVQIYFENSIYDLLDNVRINIKQNLSVEFFEKLVKDKSYFWGKFFRKPGGISIARDVCRNETDKLLSENLEEIVPIKFMNDMSEAVDKVRHDLHENINQKIDSLKEEINAIKDGVVNIEKEKIKIYQEIKELAGLKGKIMEIKKRVKELLELRDN